MTFGEVVTAVLKDSFNESRRADAKNWVIFRHAWLWNLRPWTFKNAVGTVTFTANTQQAAGPSDLHASIAMYDANGDPVRAVTDLREFFQLYNANLQPPSGAPEAYTIVDGQIFTSCKGDGSSGIIVYEKAKPMLVNDGDPTGLPDGYDLGLVHGGKAEGFKLTNIPLADNFDADFTATINALEAGYLAAVHETGSQFGAYRPC